MNVKGQALGNEWKLRGRASRDPAYSSEIENKVD
jgi:hypothetical protein